MLSLDDADLVAIPIEAPDAVIGKLICACQQDQVSAVFAYHDQLVSMGTRLFEGVYKMMVQCCLKNGQVDAAFACLKHMKASDQRPSVQALVDLVEAYMYAGESEKIWCVWADLLEPGRFLREVGEVMFAAVFALVQLRAPSRALDVLSRAEVEYGPLTNIPLDSEHISELLACNDEALLEADAKTKGPYETLRSQLQSIQVDRKTEISGSTSDMVELADLRLDLDLDIDLEDC